MTSVEENNHFVVTWKIEKFNICMFEKKMCLQTSVFSTEIDGANVFFRLKVQNVKSPAESLEFELQIIDNSLTTLKCRMSVSNIFGKVNQTCNGGLRLIAEKAALFNKKDHSIVPQAPMDSVTVHCVIIFAGITPGKRMFSTRLQKEVKEWNFNYYNFQSKLHHFDNFQIASNKANIQSDYNFAYLGLELLPNKHGIPSFVDFEAKVDNDKIPINHTNFSSNTIILCLELRTLRNFVLRIRIEFVAAIESPQVSTLEEKPKKSVSTSSSNIINDLVLLYKKTKLTDATLIANGKSFPIHKLILSARSPVFSTMFEGDQFSEGRSGVVEIDDLDSDTLDRLLVFMYSDSIDERLEWEEGSALYYAADKYCVPDLKSRCVDILRDGLSSSNVFKALVMADKHGDQELMEGAIDFFRLNEMSSIKEYDEFAETYPRLAMKLMRDLYFKKVKM